MAEVISTVQNLGQVRLTGSLPNISLVADAGFKAGHVYPGVYPVKDGSVIFNAPDKTKYVGHRAFYDPNLGRRLTDADLTPGPYFSSHDNEVIYAKYIDANFYCQHKNVTLLGCWIVGEVVQQQTADITAPLRVQFCELGYRESYRSSNTTALVAISGYNFKAFRCDIHNYSHGVHPNGESTVIECWIHDLWFTGIEHLDTIAVFIGNNVRIERNALSVTQNQTSCVGILSDIGPIDNVLVSKNYMQFRWDDQGAYFIYPGDIFIAGPPIIFPCTNIYIENNILELYNTVAGTLHHAVYPETPASGHLTGNVLTDGTPVPDQHWGGL